jgi:rhodanese-related sulfurtransferase
VPDYELGLEITPQEVKRRLEAGERLRLIDVREPAEVQLASIEGAELIPMRDIPGALPLLENGPSPLVVFCHHGVRSYRVVCWLREQGLASCQSLAGGIHRWSAEVDSRVPRYDRVVNPDRCRDASRTSAK